MYFQEEGYLVSFSSDHDARWKSQAAAEKNKEKLRGKGLTEEDQHLKTKKDLIPKGHAFSVVLITEAVGNKLLKFRSPLTSIKWDGDWSAQSKLWD